MSNLLPHLTRLQTHRRKFLVSLGAMILFACNSQSACSHDLLQVERPIAFPVDGPLRGSELVSAPPATILIGETHGTWETPLLVASLVRTVSSKKVQAVLCVEMPSKEQPLLDQFLQSDGDDAAVAVLLSARHWSGQDGRASVGQFAMLELVRQLIKQGRGVRVVAMDIEMPMFDPKNVKMAEILQFARKRDLAMAETVLAIRKKYPKSTVIVLAGNVHTKVKKGAPWDAEYIPMGWHVAQKIPKVVSLNVQSSGGEAWASTDKGIGIMGLHGIDRGRDPFIELFAQLTDGYHGVLYAGELSAARPVSGRAERSDANKH